MSDIALLEVVSISSATDASESAMDCQLSLMPKTSAESPVKSLSILLSGSTCSRMKLTAICPKKSTGSAARHIIPERALSIIAWTEAKSPLEMSTALR